MFRRMAGADDDPPVVLADADHLAVADAPVAVGQRMDALAEVAEARAVVLDGRITPAGAVVEDHAVVRRLAAGVGGEHAAVQVFQPRHPQPALELLGQPAGHADMVGVHVGGEDAAQTLAVRGLAEQLAPRGQSLVGAHAGVHHRPTVILLDAPDVDVVQHHRQRHAHPYHARRHLERLARRGRVLEGVHQRGFGQPVALGSNFSHRGVLAKCSVHQAAAADPALPVRQRRMEPCKAPCARLTPASAQALARYSLPS